MEKSYVKDFKKEFQSVQDTLNSNNTKNGSKVDYRSIISSKIERVHEMRSIDSDDDKGMVENSVQIVATLVPEWADSIFKLVNPSPQVETRAIHQEEIDQFNNYYRKHVEKTKPENMWFAPLELRFEKMEYNYYFKTGAIGENSLKTISFEQAYSYYKKVRKMMDMAHVVNERIK